MTIIIDLDMLFLYQTRGNWLNGKHILNFILSLMAASRFKKVRTWPCLPLCGIQSSFNNTL